MFYHYSNVVAGVYMFVNDEKLELKVCSKVSIACTKTIKP